MIQQAAVIGAGVMGTGIASHLATSGCQTLLVDADAAQLERARLTLGADSLRYSGDLTAIADSDFVIEAIIEDLLAKQSLLAEIEKTVRRDCVIATNTSSLLVRDMATVLGQPARFLGIHYNNPADINPIVEIIPATETSTELADAIQDFYRQSGKTTIRCADTSGFVLNRQSLPYINEAARCLSLADPGTIDQIACEELGVGLGPFAVMNLVGLKVMAAASRNLAILGPGYEASDALQKKAASDDATWMITEASSIETGLRQMVKDRLLAAQIFPGRDILENNLCDRDDLHTICTLALGYQRSSPELLEQLDEAEIELLLASYQSGETG